MKKLVVSVVALSGVGIIAMASQTVACGGGSCAYQSICGADPTPTADQVTLCENRLSDPKCGGYYSDMIGCTQSNQVCKADGTTNFDLTNAPCNDRIARWTNCYFGGTAGDAGAD
jgi:hypothetical protein